MKTFFYIAAVVTASLAFNVNASAQYDPRRYDNCRDHRQQSFYYYPQSNVYYSFATNQYIYHYRDSWIVSQRLPRNIRLKREPRFVVNHDGFNVWRDNRYHVARFNDRRYSGPQVAYGHYDLYDERNNNRNW